MNVLLPSNGKPRLSLRAYIGLCTTHFIQHWKQYTAPVAAVFLLQIFIRIDVNYTDSLPDHVFVTVKGWKSGLKKGDYIAFHFPNENPVSPFRRGDHMVKVIAGTPGDTVSMTNERGFSVLGVGETESASVKIPGSNGTLGVAKEYSKKGWRLYPGPQGVIPDGAYYVFAPHQDSLDSRYSIVGWITEKDIIGRTFAIF